LCDDPAKVTFEREGVYTDQTTGKPVAVTTRYTYRDGEDRYEVSFTRTRDLSTTRLVDTIKGLKRIAAKLTRFDGAYLRFVGAVEITRYRDGALVERHKDDAIWEMMYFGHAVTSSAEQILDRHTIGFVSCARQPGSSGDPQPKVQSTMTSCALDASRPAG
jgi:hypothetical protein